MKNTKKWLGALALMMMCAFCFTACGGGDDDGGSRSSNIDTGGNSGGNTGGGGSVSTSNIVGTWYIYFQSNDNSRGWVYNQLTFNRDYTGSLIEEVGYGSDRANPFTWTQTDNTIRIDLTGQSYAFNVDIAETIDNNTMVVNTVVNNKQGYYTVYRMTSNATSFSDIIGTTWQEYYYRVWGYVNGQKGDYTFDISPSNASGSSEPDCWRYEFYNDFTYKGYTYYKGDWLPHGPYYATINCGRYLLLGEYGSGYIHCELTKNSANEITWTRMYYSGPNNYTYEQNKLRRVEENNSSASNYTGWYIRSDIDNSLHNMVESYDKYWGGHLEISNNGELHVVYSTSEYVNVSEYALWPVFHIPDANSFEKYEGAIYKYRASAASGKTLLYKFYYEPDTLALYANITSKYSYSVNGNKLVTTEPQTYTITSTGGLIPEHETGVADDEYVKYNKE